MKRSMCRSNFILDPWANLTQKRPKFVPHADHFTTQCVSWTWHACTGHAPPWLTHTPTSYCTPIVPEQMPSFSMPPCPHSLPSELTLDVPGASLALLSRCRAPWPVRSSFSPLLCSLSVLIERDIVFSNTHHTSHASSLARTTTAVLQPPTVVASGRWHAWPGHHGPPRGKPWLPAGAWGPPGAPLPLHCRR